MALFPAPMYLQDYLYNMLFWDHTPNCQSTDMPLLPLLEFKNSVLHQDVSELPASLTIECLASRCEPWTMQKATTSARLSVNRLLSGSALVPRTLLHVFTALHRIYCLQIWILHGTWQRCGRLSAIRHCLFCSESSTVRGCKTRHF